MAACDVTSEVELHEMSFGLRHPLEDFARKVIEQRLAALVERLRAGIDVLQRLLAQKHQPGRPARAFLDAALRARIDDLADKFSDQLRRPRHRRTSACAHRAAPSGRWRAGEQKPPGLPLD